MELTTIKIDDQNQLAEIFYLDGSIFISTKTGYYKQLPNQLQSINRRRYEANKNAFLSRGN